MVPKAKWQKFSFCQFFSGNFLAKWEPSEMVTLGTIGPNGHKISFSQDAFWQNGGHLKWPLWTPYLRSNAQK
jgi:hypothetical protein